MTDFDVTRREGLQHAAVRYIRELPLARGKLLFEDAAMMGRLMAIATSLMFLSSLPAEAQKMEVSPNGSRPTTAAPAEYFTGSALLEPLFTTKDSMPATGGLVIFMPGARSAWHTHPAGQLLIVTSGTGWIQEEGGAKREIKPGDVVWTPPGVKHWHGATAANAMSHVAITNMVNGKNVEWLEKVSEEQYQK